MIKITKNKTKKRNKKRIGKIIFLIALIIFFGFSLAINVVISQYEKKNFPKTHYALLPANDDNAFRTYRNLTKGEIFRYDIFISGENVSDIWIFLVTYEIYSEQPVGDANDKYLYYEFDTNCVTLRYSTAFRSESGVEKIQADGDYLVILINLEDEDLEVNFYYELSKVCYITSKTTNNILLSLSALLIPFVTIYLAVNELILKNKENSNDQDDKASESNNQKIIDPQKKQSSTKKSNKT